MKDSLGDRMKDYESVSKNRLTRRVPVIVRTDGKSFHTFCKRFAKPYDEFFNECMNRVMKFICENVQGAKFAERHSDEISIMITDYDKETTDCYFDYSVQKIVSVVASMATAELCRQLMRGNSGYSTGASLIYDKLTMDEPWPMFDCRCFNIPEFEISNYVWWRMLDAKRNSINMLAQSKFSHKQLQGKTCDEIQEMLFQECGINWNNISQGQKAGFYCIKQEVEKEVTDGPNKGQIFKRRIWNVLPSVATKAEIDTIISSSQHNL